MLMLKIAVALLTSLFAGSAAAVTILTATLTDGTENPPTNPTTATGAPRLSFGSATFVINDAMTSMTFAAMIFGIDVTGTQTADPNDNLVAAHIHAALTVTPTTNGPVVWGFFGTPFNDTSPDDAVVAPFVNDVGGTFSGKWDLSEGNGTTFAAQLANILSGHAYINFHTTQFPGGEIRGNITAVTLVPEPETYLLLLGGLGLIAATARRRNRL
jgi:CHRD domain/PEP-CTERM motif